MNLNLEKKDYIYIGIFIILILYIFNISSSVEKMTESTSTESIRSAIKDVYEVDVQAIKNLGDLAKDILNNEGTLKLPYDVEIKGNLETTGASNLAGDVNITGNLETTGTSNLAGDVTTKNLILTGDKIEAPGRLHIYSGENIYMLAKDKTLIGGNSQSSGNFEVTGNSEARNNLTVAGGRIKLTKTTEGAGKINLKNRNSTKDCTIRGDHDSNGNMVVVDGNFYTNGNIEATTNVEAGGAVTSRYFDILRAPKSDTFNTSKTTIAYRLQYPDNGNNDILFQGNKADQGSTTNTQLAHINLREDSDHM